MGAQDYGGAKVHIDHIIEAFNGLEANKYVLWFDIQIHQIHLLV